MRYKILLTDSTYRDLKEIKTYITLSDESIAKKYISKIFDKLNNLKDFPYIGHKINNSIFDYANCLYLPVMNHIAIYQINELAKCVYIIRVLSHFQDWKDIINKDILSINKPIISDDVLSIVHMNTSMYYDVWKNSLDDDNRKYVPDEVFETLEEASAVVDQIIKNYPSKDGPFVYAIIRKSDNTNIGYVQLVKTCEGWEIGYHIAKLYTGNGYATKAVGMFIDYLKDNTDIKELYGIALWINKASKRVLEKKNFVLTFKGNGLYQGRRRKIVKMMWRK